MGWGHRSEELPLNFYFQYLVHSSSNMAVGGIPGQRKNPTSKYKIVQIS